MSLFVSNKFKPIFLSTASMKLCEWEPMNGQALIFGTNQEQRRLVRKELGTHVDYSYPTIGRQLTDTRPGSRILSSRHLYPLGSFFFYVAEQFVIVLFL